MLMEWHIYVLKDPVTDEVRYVGVTHGNPASRLAQHIRRSRKGTTHSAYWIKSLSISGLVPSLDVVEVGNGPTWGEREAHWISTYRSSGAHLTNHTDGGEGTLGWRPTKEWREKQSKSKRGVPTGLVPNEVTRKKMSDSRKRQQEELLKAGLRRKMPPKSPETLERMAASQRGKKLSESTRKKLSEAHSNVSDETRKKLSEAAHKRPRELIEAIASKLRGKSKSEETRSRMKKSKSPEHKAKIKAALQAHHANKKGRVSQ